VEVEERGKGEEKGGRRRSEMGARPVGLGFRVLFDWWGNSDGFRPLDGGSGRLWHDQWGDPWVLWISVLIS
jgi:hypothetical protein